MLPLAALLLAAGVAARDPVGQNLIVLLLDGYGAGLLNSSKADSTFGVRELASQGVQAEYLKGVFPTHTYPNWMSLATGLYAENHGFTADYMWDQSSGLSFQRGYGANDTEDVWWEGRPAPLWYSAGKRGVDVHCYWFAHCHRAHGDMVVSVPMRRWADLSKPEQTDALPDAFPEIVKRISKYQAYKQQMFLLRYAGVEQALRTHAAGSDEVEAAVARADLHVHDLQQKLSDAGLFSSTNLVVLSTHGLAALEDEEQFYLEECLADYSKVKRVVNSHSMLMVFTEPEDEDNIFFELKVCDQWAPMGDYEDTDTPLVAVYRAADVPERLRWAGGRFMSGIVLITKPGTSIITRELASLPAVSDTSRDVKQTSGWDPEATQMHGVFMARGPAFRVDEKFGPISSVDVYQVLLNIVGVEPSHPHNGTWSAVEEMLAEGWEDRPNSERFNVSWRALVSLPLLLCLFLRFE